MLEAGLPNLEETTAREFRFPRGLLTIAVVSMLVAVSWLGWAAVFSDRDERALVERMSRIDRLHGTIVHLDEVLTMSTRMAAETGDARWEKQYRRFEPDLDVAIEETLKLGNDSADLAYATKTKEANVKLVEMENHIFALASVGRKGEAQSLLCSPEYEAQKSNYSEGMTSFDEHTRRDLEERLRKGRREDLLSIIAALIAAVISVTTWISAMRNIQRGRATLEASTSAQASLHAATSALERKGLEEELFSERKRSEQSAARLSEIDEATTDLISTSDAEGRLISINRGGRKMLDMDEEADITKYSIADFLPNTPNHVIPTTGLPTAMRDGVWTGEAELMSLKGRRIPISQVILSHNRPDGSIELLSCIARDITERKNMEEALYVEKERAEVTLNSIGDAVISTDIAGNITFLNLVAETMTGWSGKEAVNRPMAEVFRILDASTREIIANPMEMAIGKDKTVHLPPRCLLRRRDGFEIPIEDSAAPIHDREGEATGAVIVFHDVSAARAMAQQMAHAAEHDFLTGLPNRMLLNDRISQAIASAPRHLKHVAVLFLDLDGFKHINDSLGHSVGDKVLQSVAKRLGDCVRGADTVSRQGGDEFVILLSEVEQAEDAAITARRMLQSVAEPQSIGPHELHVTTSIGLSIYPDDGLDAETLIRNADTAMYQAKENGRQSYQFFKPAMNVRAVERQWIEESLRRALERREFALHYQPKINLRTGAIAGVEALIRWTHPARGIISPAQFIPVAEDSGLIVPIGNWVLREACRQAKAWEDAGLLLGTMAVNVSAMELRDLNFLRGFFSILGETGLDPQSLEMELTESVLMKHAESAASILRTVRERGMQVAMDDFGTGFSSLSYLQKFPVDALKIDQSFTRQITGDGGDTRIVTAVISMARSLKLRVVAEGVETQEQLEFLRAHECDEAQGYYFSRPVPPDQFAKLLGAVISEPSVVVQSWAPAGDF